MYYLKPLKQELRITGEGDYMNELDLNKAIKAAIKEYDKEQKMKQKKEVFHNTRLLLLNYNDLIYHVNKAVDNIHDTDIDILEDGTMDSDDLYIFSIKRSKLKTLIMIAHIDRALDELKKEHQRLLSQEKYDTLEAWFKEGLTYEEIAEKMNISTPTVRRWVNQMITSLGVKLFGIDGLKLSMIQT